MAFSESISRRAAIAGLALPAVTPALAAFNNPDAELLRLDAELEARWVTWWALWAPTEDANEAANEELSQHVSWYRAMTMSDTEFQEWFRVANEIRERRGVNAMNRDRAIALEALEAIREQIFSIPPRTLTGAAVQARALATLKYDLWWYDTDEQSEKVLAQVIECIVEAAGLQMPADLVEVTAS